MFDYKYIKHALAVLVAILMFVSAGRVTFGAGGNMITLGLGPGRAPERSPDGGRIAYVDSGYIIWIDNPDGSGAAALTSDGGGPYGSPEKRGKQPASRRQTRSRARSEGHP